MSLSSLLLGKNAPIDSELDNLFQIPVARAAIPGPSKDIKIKKRKLEAEKETVPEKLLKRVKSVSKATGSSTSNVDKAEQHNSKPKAKKPSKASKGKGKEIETDNDEDDEKLENAYLNSKPAPVSDSKDQESDNEGDGDPTTLVHESVNKASKKSSRSAKSKYIPEEETPELREQRTIFVGNLPLEVASKKPLKKQLQRHILSFLPTAKIESIRFRSVPFQTPTAKLPTSDDEGGGSKPKAQAQKKEPRQHDKERASVWRSKLDEKDEETIKNDEKRFLNPAQKKRIAFINQEFHSTADTVNAYIVFAHAPDVDRHPANLPPPGPTLDPYEAARLAAEKCDGTLFMERMLRVDLVDKKSSTGPNGGTDALKHSSTLGTDPRLSVFVGNLEFASKEEDLRIFFEGIISAEKGPPPPISQDNIDTSEEVGSSTRRPATWVTRVRIVRDKDTQLGKGFAYVQFADRECVDELLGLEEDKLKFAKRKLRVQRCKTLPGAKQVVPSQNKSGNASVTVVVPKGDPALGERLAGLPKDERKQLKSSNADRVARRLAKKKARMGMKPAAGKPKPNIKSRERKRGRS